MAPPTPVAITGVGPVSAAGIGAAALWASLTAPGDPAVTPGPLEGFDATPWLTTSDARRTDPYLQYALVAAALALDDAGDPSFEPDRAGVVMGNLYGAATTLEAQQAVLADRGPKAVSPLLAAHACEDACASQISLHYGLRGPSRLVGASCASGTLAVAEGAALIATGSCDLVLAGATLGPVTEVLQASYQNLRVLATGPRARPLDRRRDGFVIAAGACVLVLESAEHAAARRASVAGWVLGWGQTNDAHHVSKPSGEGIERCLRTALDHAGVAPADVAHVNAHATGTGSGDRHEAAAIARIFGPGAPSVTSIKGRSGHTLAAAGAFEAAAVVLSFRHRLLPPTAADLEPDPDIDLDVVAGTARPWTPGIVVSSSFGLGGQNAGVVLAPDRI